MRADFLSYKRATSVCLVGLGLQSLMGISLLIYAAIIGDHATLTASLATLLGVIVWLTLAVLFDQHRRERVEAIEAEALSNTGRAEATIFADVDDELRVAARRLAWMHRFFLPAVSLVFASLMIILGVVRFGIGRELATKIFVVPGNRGWLIAIAVGVGVIGFVFARFVSGMAKQRVWQNLRGGATQAVLAAIFGLFLVVGHFLDIAGFDGLAQILPIIFPIFTIIVGVETVLSFILGIYRPRQSGEMPRPAFDSKLLSFFAAPDRIADSIGEALNYQFGIDIRSTWFYQLLQKSVMVLVVLGVASVWVMSFFSIVQPNERGLRLTNGRLVGDVLEPGPYLKAPAPFGRIERYPADSVRRLDLGSQPPLQDRAILWTTKHVEGEERFFIVQPSKQRATGQDIHDERSALQQNDDLAAVRDVALAAAEVPMYFSVRDLIAFEQFAAPEAREELIRAIGKREVFKLLASLTVDELLSSDRAVLGERLRQRVQAALDRHNTGVHVVMLTVAGVHPPHDTAPMFEEVIIAEQNRLGALEAARREEVQRLTEAVGDLRTARTVVQRIDDISVMRSRNAPSSEIAEAEREVAVLLERSGGQAAKVIGEARAERWHRHMFARGRADRHAGRLAMFTAEPSVYMADEYFRTLTEVLTTARVFIAPHGTETRLNLEERGSATQGIIDRLAQPRE